ncbi:hypothetical protein GX408_15750 [bacterium]|nr:hypothetical protein [bacterium]
MIDNSDPLKLKLDAQDETKRQVAALSKDVAIETELEKIYSAVCSDHGH